MTILGLLRILGILPSANIKKSSSEAPSLCFASATDWVKVDLILCLGAENSFLVESQKYTSTYLCPSQQFRRTYELSSAIIAIIVLRDCRMEIYEKENLYLEIVQNLKYCKLCFFKQIQKKVYSLQSSRKLLASKKEQLNISIV